MKTKNILTVFLIGCATFASLPAQDLSHIVIRNGNDKELYFQKQQAMQIPVITDTTLSDLDRPERKDAIMSGNQIRTLVYDYGSIGYPNLEPSMEWPIYSSHGYAYEFGPLVGVEVPVDTNGYFLHEAYTGAEGNKTIDKSTVGYDTTYYIVCDGLVSGGGVSMGDLSPTNYPWGWEPLDEYGNPESESLPVSTDKSTWNSSWNGTWPGTYKAGQATADQAIYYEMDDRYNKEFYPAYRPYPETHERAEYGGCGLSVVARAYQWSNPEASDVIFFVYEITNESDNDYEKVVFGMFGDPHIGGSNDYSDDMAYFDNQLNMVYGYDGDDKGDWNGSTGWLGYTFLESPGNPYDGIDNDGDGIIDESMSDGIDNDNDWNIDEDDVGMDGLGPNDVGYPGPDQGEGDGVATAGDPNDPTKPGEPHFDANDLDEADQIGLTSFDAFEYGASGVKYDNDMWKRMKPETPLTDDNTEITQRADNIFLYGSGYFPLKAGDTQRFSIAILMGENKRDLYETASTVQTIYDNGYQFAVAPNKPKLTVVPGDGKAFLYWDDNAESSYDPLFGYDFQGYAIYRATDPGFNECLTITNNYGVATLYDPIAKYDLEDGITGAAKCGSNGIHYDLGTDNGLVHEFVDTGLVNGVTYYYAVCSYDIGDTTGLLNLTPTECTKIINQDAYTYEISLDDNTGYATPQRESPGVQSPGFFNGSIDRSACKQGTGDFDIEFVDYSAVIEGKEYEVFFENSGTAGATELSLTDLSTVYRDTVEAISTLWLQLNKTKISHVKVYDEDMNQVSTSLYNIDAPTGRIQFDASLLNETFYLEFNYNPIYQSAYLNGEDGMQVFDGMKLYITDEELSRDKDKSGWLNSDNTLLSSIQKASDSIYNHEYKLVWNEDYENEPTVFNQYAPFKIYDMTNDTTEAPVYFSPHTSGHYEVNKSDIFILSQATPSMNYAVWRLWFNYPVAKDTILPADGDVYQIIMNRPFSIQDTIRFQTAEATYDPSTVEDPLDMITVVPNPYCAAAIWEPSTGYAAGRGERRVYFTNLPPVCTIKIYTISGEHVRTLEHNDGGNLNAVMFDGSESFNLLNKDNSDIAFGVYIWYVDARASGLGTKTGKFSVIK